MKNDFSTIRNDYGDRALKESEIPSDPIQLVQEWMDEAINEGSFEPTAIALSTIDSVGFPSSRMVLLKEIKASKLIFFSNYNSAKGRELAQDSKAGMLFFWPQLHRQIRIKGIVEKLSEKQSDSYFNERPYESKLGAWSSLQSELIANRTVLESNYEHFEKEFKNKFIPRPEFWGGYELNPISFEFWQGRKRRLHDRVVFSKDDDNWKVERLAP